MKDQTQIKISDNFMILYKDKTLSMVRQLAREVSGESNFCVNYAILNKRSYTKCHVNEPDHHEWIWAHIIEHHLDENVLKRVSIL